MTLAFYYDDSQYRYAASPANAVQCLRSNTAQDSIYNLWGGGNSVNLVHSTPAAGSGALLMMGRTEELVRALHHDQDVSNIERIWGSDDALVVFYVRCHIAGGAFSAGHTHTVVSVAPLWKYWGLQRSFLTTLQGHNSWFSMYPWNQQDPEIFNSGIELRLIRERVHFVDQFDAFQGLRFG
jgi:hypothetical protein